MLLIIVSKKSRTLEVLLTIGSQKKTQEFQENESVTNIISQENMDTGKCY